MRAYLTDRPDLTRVALIRDCTDWLRIVPALNTAGLMKRRAIAAAVVDAVWPQQESKS